MTKKFLSLLAICAIVFLANCSRIEQNTDPIIGIWSQSDLTVTESSSKQTIRKEWIFNDVYLGRYHEIEGSTITLKTDFNWSKQDDVYTVEYKGLEGKPNNIITIKSSEENVYLQKKDGATLAIRE
ncbi:MULTISPECIES: hypothetical protein [Maribacter]|uniref:Lipocalin-like domain-containing protein n=1 Tax=Maribacter dokdonensis TaxID=320912 RepID=A0A1H4NZA0_9FLAO|nr:MULTISPECIES: hypothetical protein [Maribacter]CAG2531327.1 hypothetical protein MAR621_01851 [Maribacter dokdonensis]SDS96122.1 hypothetical protein SAMN05192545_2450 [Maribacter dokdonensis]SEC00355.1 hypothetical protein SAMN05192540_2103 [Maribacter dokdonensis]|tara:strand:+ start:137 stop:514 length:378 start_codon:yes stop_codon:yes gene_type:complete